MGRHFVINLSTSFAELQPLCYFHLSAVCPSTLSVRVTLMTLMEIAVFASLLSPPPPQHTHTLLHLYTSILRLISQ